MVFVWIIAAFGLATTAVRDAGEAGLGTGSIDAIVVCEHHLKTIVILPAQRMSAKRAATATFEYRS